jgi:transcriptional regulator with XRE-family HTH domain
MIMEREWTLKHEESLIPTLGGRIRHARVARGYDSQEKFRQALRTVGIDVGNSMITELEKDRAKPSYDVLLGIAKVLDRSLDWLCCVPVKTPVPDEPIYSDESLNVANKIDSLPVEIKQEVIGELLKIIQEHYEAYNLRREFGRLLNLVSDRGDRDLLDSLKRLIRLKRVGNIIE